MNIINVELRGVRVSSFYAAQEEVTLVISFNDGKEKEVTKTLKLKDGHAAATEILRDIRRVENSLNAEFDGKSILDNYINIIIKDEDKANEKLAIFLSKVFEKVKVIKNQKTAEGYVSLINSVNSMKTDF